MGVTGGTMTLERSRRNYFRSGSPKNLIVSTMAIFLLSWVGGCGNGSSSVCINTITQQGFKINRHEAGITVTDQGLASLSIVPDFFYGK